ncbi:MAG: hypothetical protein HOV68_09785 [Streptomycetaceae bacterium]|nr:hypothetical protein [Streptomycetaceae bacterium]
MLGPFDGRSLARGASAESGGEAVEQADEFRAGPVSFGYEHGEPIQGQRNRIDDLVEEDFLGKALPLGPGYPAQYALGRHDDRDGLHAGLAPERRVLFERLVAPGALLGGFGFAGLEGNAHGADEGTGSDRSGDLAPHSGLPPVPG